MNIKTVVIDNKVIAVVECDEVCIKDTQTALDFMMSVNYETGSNYVAINKEAFAHDFYVLSTRLAGEVLQKFVTYRFKLAIIGDYSMYTSKPLKDFMYECKSGTDIFFVPSTEEALERLSKATAN